VSLLLVWRLLRRRSLTPATLRGPAAIRHPWRGAALAASMPLGPLRAACVQPAPKSRFVVSGRLRTKIKIKIDGDGDGDGDGNGVHRTCSSPACRRRRFHIRHRRPNGTPPGPTATRGGMHIRAMIVPTLRVGMPFRTLRVQADAERQSLRYHAERGNDQKDQTVDRCPACEAR
jgi:hypothetical protein